MEEEEPDIDTLIRTQGYIFLMLTPGGKLKLGKIKNIYTEAKMSRTIISLIRNFHLSLETVDGYDHFLYREDDNKYPCLNPV